MNRNLRGRLDRLECQHETKNKLPPQFWDALFGAVPLDEVDPKTRQLIESLCGDSRNEPDPIKARIEQVGKSRRTTTAPIRVGCCI